MAVETSLQPRQKWWNILYAVICGGLALWGAYDYWVTIPRREEAVRQYDAAAARFEELEAKTRPPAPGGTGGTLTAAEVEEYKQAKAVVDKGKPVAPQAYDRPVQMYLYIIGCGVLGVPWFLWQWVAVAGKKYRLEENGTLVTPGGQPIAASDIEDIDMTKWMSKSIATVKARGGRTVVLDDYKFRNTHLIVGAIASRLYPDAWTSDARDLAKIRAQEAEAGGEATDGAGTAASKGDPAPKA
jgi:hypothetical protein